LPAGTTLVPAIVMVHHDPAVWPDPERFQPERFLDRRATPHEFLPFGGGSRRCLGAAFARFEAAIVLATVLREFDLELLDRDVAYGREGLMLGPIGGIRMMNRGRRAAA
jgi:cytochrome P450